MSDKPFQIKKPRKGTTTATLVALPYQRDTTKKTKTEYLGSFNAKLDPLLLEDVQGLAAGQRAHGIRLVPGKTVIGIPFALDASGIADIRAWLLEHGTAERERKAKSVAEAQAEQMAVAQRARLTSEIEVELRSRLEEQWHAELVTAQQKDPIAFAVEALRIAGRYVVEEAGRLKETGSRLTTAGQGRGTNGASTALDKFAVRTKSLRTTAFDDFNKACQAAGVMRRG